VRRAARASHPSCSQTCLDAGAERHVHNEARLPVKPRLFRLGAALLGPPSTYPAAHAREALEDFATGLWGRKYPAIALEEPAGWTS
jgi:hypothetical protein